MAQGHPERAIGQYRDNLKRVQSTINDLDTGVVGGEGWSNEKDVGAHSTFRG